MTTATNIAYRVWQDLGKIEAYEQFIATGGSTTTILNGRFADRAERPEDNYSIDYTAMVIRDSAGASAAPEGEMRRISAYVSSNYTHTVDTAFSAAVASGDEIAIANSDIPMYEMLRAINNALVKFGEIPAVDTSLTSDARQTEYTLPVALKRDDLLRVEYQQYTGDPDNNYWEHVQNWDLIPAAPGSTGLLVIPQIPSGRSIRLTYIGVHPTITSGTSSISEYIHPNLIIAAVTKQALRWFNGTSGGGENYWLQRENEAAQELETLFMKYPIWIPKLSPKYTNFKQALTPRKERRMREDTYYGE